jgi:nitrite reductase/ring-hydroxylating ferredoxin subunit/uncharacterized membrane protein
MSTATPGRLAQAVERAVGRIERAERLDPVAEKISGTLGPILSHRGARSVLSGTAGGHPAHPALVLAPVGAWLSSAALDALGGPASRRSARRLVGLGLATVAPAALTGASDWFYTAGAERRVGLVHAATNYTAVGLYTGSWLARRRGHHHVGVALGALGLSAVSIAGWLGGHLTYARGVGVDTTAFQVAPADWVDVIAEAEVTAETPTLVHAGPTPVLLLRHDGEWTAMADRCTHRGAPLHQGSIEAGCIVCPWHDSLFALDDGHVEAGPATRPQPMYEVRTRYGMVQVRRSDEPGSLRSNVAD